MGQKTRDDISGGQGDQSNKQCDRECSSNELVMIFTAFFARLAHNDKKNTKGDVLNPV